MTSVATIVETPVSAKSMFIERAEHISDAMFSNMKPPAERPVVYMTDQQHSRIVGTAFMEGCNGLASAPYSLLPGGPAILYGILRGCGNIVHECEWLGREYYHIDHGYFARGHYDGYYRVTRNALQAEGDIDLEHATADRWNALGIRSKPWRRDGREIVICPMTDAIGEFRGVNPHAWTTTVCRELARHTDRPVVVSTKDPNRSLADTLRNAWCVVVYNSNLAVDALVQGTPTIALGPTPAHVCSWTFDQIESPVWPDRERLFWALAQNQWTLAEFRDGTCWRHLQDQRT